MAPFRREAPGMRDKVLKRGRVDKEEPRVGRPRSGHGEPGTSGAGGNLLQNLRYGVWSWLSEAKNLFFSISS